MFELDLHCLPHPCKVKNLTFFSQDSEAQRPCNCVCGTFYVAFGMCRSRGGGGGAGGHCAHRKYKDIGFISNTGLGSH